MIHQKLEKVNLLKLKHLKIKHIKMKKVVENLIWILRKVIILEMMVVVMMAVQFNHKMLIENFNSDKNNKINHKYQTYYLRFQLNNYNNVKNKFNHNLRCLQNKALNKKNHKLLVYNNKYYRYKVNNNKVSNY